MISIAVVTCNRLHLLRDCVEKVVQTASDETTQVVIWNNASTDGTREFLDSVSGGRIEVVHHEKNIGTNAFARALDLCKGEYLIELDDDVIDAPEGWDRMLREALDALPEYGYLAAHCLDDGKSTAADILYRKSAHLYKPITVNGVELLDGPAGGWCSITPRKIFDQVGGFDEDPRFNFAREDGDYIAKVYDAGFKAALLASLKVFHASGPAYSDDKLVEAEKARYYEWRDRRRKFRHRVKQALDAIPPVRFLNKKLGLYTIVDAHGQSSTGYRTADQEAHG